MALAAYHYESVDDTHIRLLDLQPISRGDPLACNLRVVPTSNSGSFEALSYCWGSPDQTEVILCNKARVEISANLAMALRRLRLDSQPRTLWVDQICINQQDIPEKNVQVRLMPFMYSQAEQVLIWTGEEDGETELMIKAMENLIRTGIQEFLGTKEVNLRAEILSVISPSASREWVAFRKFLRAPWFTRTWVFQEMVLSKKATIICGSFSTSWETVFVSHQFLAQLDRHLPEHLVYLQGDVRSFQGLALSNTLTKMWRSSGSQLFEGSNPLDLLALVVLLLGNKVTDPRDKIYGVLGVATDLGHAYPGVHYDTPLQLVYGQYTKWFIDRYRDLSALKYVSITPGTGERATCRDLPSWIPNYRVRDYWNNLRLFQGPLNPPHGLKRSYNATGSSMSRFSDNDPLQLTVRGICIGRITQVSDSAGNFRGEIAAEVLTGGKWPQLAADWAIDGRYQQTKEPMGTAYARLRIADYLPGEVDSAARRARSPQTSIPEPGDMLPFAQTDRDSHYARDDIGRRILYATTRQRLYLTDSGYMGICHHSCVTGDQVYLLMGGDMPFILRDLRNGGFQLKGESYVHGVMDGEILLKYRSYGDDNHTDEEWLGALGDGLDQPWPFQTETILLT